jgi:DNA-directed RNA polymerase sigma subunit (sigma70/sigma32)
LQAHIREHDLHLLREVVEEILQDMPARNRDMLVRSVNRETLSSIGDSHGRTKERVRQIVKKEKEALRKRPGLLKRLEPFLDSAD